MGKSSRIVLLSVTATLAVAAFLVLWAVRPGQDSDVLAQARERQNQNLLDVREPLETDPAAISEAESFAAEVEQIILTDDQFVGSLSEAVAGTEGFQTQVEGIVTPAAEAAMRDAAGIAAETAAATSEELIQAAVDEYYPQVEQLIRDIAAETAASTSEELIQTAVDEYYPVVEQIVAEAAALAAVDEEAIVELVTERIYADIQAYVEAVDIERIVDDAVAAATSYTDDAVAGALDSATAYGEGLLADANAYTDDAVASAVDSDEVARIVTQVMESYRTSLANEIAGEVLARVEAEVYPAVGEMVNQGASSQRAVVSSPNFTFTPNVTVEENYAPTRESVRQNAITSVMERLNSGN